MAWNTVHDYINDPGGFEATHRRFKAATGGVNAAALYLMENPVDAHGARVRDPCHYHKIALAEAQRHAHKLEAVADAARAYVWVEREGDDMEKCIAYFGALGDALDALDVGGAGDVGEVNIWAGKQLHVVGEVVPLDVGCHGPDDNVTVGER